MGSGEMLLRRKEGNQSMVEVNLGDRWADASDSFQVFLPLASLNDLTETSGDGVLVDLGSYAEFRFSTSVLTAGVTGRLKPAYVLDTDSFDLSSLGQYIDLSAEGVQRTEWEPIPAVAQSLCFVYFAAYNGNGSEDPSILSGLLVEFRR